jgi:hypothetical protein
MSFHTIEGQSALVAYGPHSDGVFVAVRGRELEKSVEADPSPDHYWVSCDPGLYVWEGDYTYETGGWAGTEPVEPDEWWNGELRRALPVDLERFGII